MSALTIALIVLAVLFVFGAGSCLICVGLAASVDAPGPAPSQTATPATTTTTTTTATATALKPASAPTSKPAATPKPSSGPRVVDFVCPPGKAPGGAVRAGCLCGSDILGSACGAPGNFTDVVETPRGCRFTCN